MVTITLVESHVLEDTTTAMGMDTVTITLMENTITRMEMVTITHMVPTDTGMTIMAIVTEMTNTS